jgi:DNA-directed RNA polymerase subunit RPC12/RpoP
MFGSLSSSMSGNDQQGPLKYYCMNCGKEHKEIACPNCGSKMKRVGKVRLIQGDQSVVYN